MANGFDGTKIDSSNLGAVWERVAEFVKKITGNVNVTTDGTLQEQITKANTQISSMSSEIEVMKKQIEELSGTTYITTEDGSYIATEDGNNIIAE